MSRIEMEFRGLPRAASANEVAWLVENLTAMRDEYPDATIRVISDAHGVTLEAEELRPVVVQRLSSGKEVPA